MAIKVLVTGGKGGTGKTFVATNLAYLAARKGIATLLVDADVGNPNTWISLGASKPRRIATVYSYRPSIDESRCSLCGKCVEVCPAHALALIPGKRVLLIDTLCEGCMLCMYVCPQRAVNQLMSEVGWISVTRHGPLDVLVGELRPGERHEDLVVEKLLEYLANAEQGKELIVIDSPAGTRLVYKLAKRSDRYVCVVEPTPLSLNGMKRLMRFIDPRKTVGVVNKVGMAPEMERAIRTLFQELSIPWIEIPFSQRIAQLYANSIPVVAVGVEGVDIEGLFMELLKAVLNR